MASDTGIFYSTSRALLDTILYLDPANAISQLLIDGMAVLYAEYYLLMFFCVRPYRSSWYRASYSGRSSPPGGSEES